MPVTRLPAGKALGMALTADNMLDCRRDAAPVREDIFEIGLEGMSVTELSQRLALPTGDVVKTLFMKGIMVQVNQVRPSINHINQGKQLPAQAHQT